MVKETKIDRCTRHECSIEQLREIIQTQAVWNQATTDKMKILKYLIWLSLILSLLAIAGRLAIDIIDKIPKI